MLLLRGKLLVIVLQNNVQHKLIILSLLKGIRKEELLSPLPFHREYQKSKKGSHCPLQSMSYLLCVWKSDLRQLMDIPMSSNRYASAVLSFILSNPKESGQH